MKPLHPAGLNEELSLTWLTVINFMINGSQLHLELKTQIRGHMGVFIHVLSVYSFWYPCKSCDHTQVADDFLLIGHCCLPGSLNCADDCRLLNM